MGTVEKLRKAFRTLPRQKDHGTYRFDSCSHEQSLITVEASTDAREYVNICPECLGIALKDKEKTKQKFNIE